MEREAREYNPDEEATTMIAEAKAEQAAQQETESGQPAKKAPSTAGRRGATRAAQALALVKEQPGITIPELAVKMGVKQNHLYRVLPALEHDRKVTKQGRGWHPVKETAAESSPSKPLVLVTQLRETYLRQPPIQAAALLGQILRFIGAG